MLLALSVIAPAQAQQPAPTPDIADFLRQLTSAASNKDVWRVTSDVSQSLDKALDRASIAELQTSLPTLVALTENPSVPVRATALESLATIALEDPDNPPSDHHTTQDGANLLVPFIPRLTPCLNDPDPTARGACLALMGCLVSDSRPTPPLLIDVLLKALEDPGSTKPAFSDTDTRSLTGSDMIMGPEIVDALLGLYLTTEFDPISHKLVDRADPVDRSGPVVLAAIIRFLHRPDQTSPSLVLTIDDISSAGLTVPALNTELISLLDYPDDSVRMVLVDDLHRFSFPASAVPAINSRLTRLASDPSASPKLRAEVARVIPCWNTDQTHMCPPHQINVRPAPMR